LSKRQVEKTAVKVEQILDKIICRFFSIFKANGDIIKDDWFRQLAP